MKLCSCLNTVIHNKNSRRTRQKNRTESGAIYKWSLKKYIGHYYSGLEGMVRMPDAALERNLTAEGILHDINDRNCFDFEYIPTEGHNLEIYSDDDKYYRKFVSFIFRNDKWVIDVYDGFRHETEIVNHGNVKFEP
ncbi:hypothetical protein [Flavobacterium sp. FlaQc-48]|uniref:hypothetical protein n=1 Tax=Flavobacterium sp. FlaQc-48 TaxID=3374181 RepID=UPI003756636E